MQPELRCSDASEGSHSSAADTCSVARAAQLQPQQQQQQHLPPSPGHRRHFSDGGVAECSDAVVEMSSPAYGVRAASEDWLAKRAREAARRALEAEKVAAEAQAEHAATVARIEMAREKQGDRQGVGDAGAEMHEVEHAAGNEPTKLLEKERQKERTDSGGDHRNAHFLDDGAQLRLLHAVAVSDSVSASEVEILHAAVIQCTAWGEINHQMTDRLARLTRKVEDGTCNGAELVSWKLAELLVLQLQDQSWTEEALKVKLATLLTMRTLAQKGAAGFKWALMATAAESAEALAQMSQLTGLSEGLAPAEAVLVDEVVQAAVGFLADGQEPSATNTTASSTCAATISAGSGPGAAASVMRAGKAALSLAGDAAGKVIRIEQVPISELQKQGGGGHGPKKKKDRPRSPPQPKAVTLHRHGQAGFGLHIDDNGVIVGAKAAAVKAGIQVGCQIIAVNSRMVSSKAEILAEAAAATAAASAVSLSADCSAVNDRISDPGGSCRGENAETGGDSVEVVFTTMPICKKGVRANQVERSPSPEQKLVQQGRQPSSQIQQSSSNKLVAGNAESLDPKCSETGTQAEMLPQPMALSLLFCKNELLTKDCTLDATVTNMAELIAVASDRLLGDVAAGLGELFISRAMSERLQAAHFELTGKPLTGKLAVPVAALSELRNDSGSNEVSGVGGALPCSSCSPSDLLNKDNDELSAQKSSASRVSVQIWLRASGWEPLDECRREVAASRILKKQYLTTVAKLEAAMAEFEEVGNGPLENTNWQQEDLSTATSLAAASGSTSILSPYTASNGRCAAEPTGHGVDGSRQKLGSVNRSVTADREQWGRQLQQRLLSPDFTIESVWKACAEQGGARTLATLRASQDKAKNLSEEVQRREVALFEQLQRMHMQQRRATAAALEELPDKLQKKHKLDVKQRLQQSYRLLFEARGFSNFCQVAESFYRILNDEADNEQAWMGLDEVAEANLKARIFVFFKVHDQAGDLHDPWVKEEARELAAIHTKRGNSMLNRLKAKFNSEMLGGVASCGNSQQNFVPESVEAALETCRNAADLFRSALRLHTPNEAAEDGLAAAQAQLKKLRELQSVGERESQPGLEGSSAHGPDGINTAWAMSVSSSSDSSGTVTLGSGTKKKSGRKNSIAVPFTRSSAKTAAATSTMQSLADHAKAQHAKVAWERDRAMVHQIFVAVDDDADGYLNFQELSELACKTDGVLSGEDYIALCHVIGADPLRGLTEIELEKVYNEFGWGDATADFEKLRSFEQLGRAGKVASTHNTSGSNYTGGSLSNGPNTGSSSNRASSESGSGFSERSGGSGGPARHSGSAVYSHTNLFSHQRPHISRLGSSGSSRSYGSAGSGGGRSGSAYPAGLRRASSSGGSSHHSRSSRSSGSRHSAGNKNHHYSYAHYRSSRYSGSSHRSGSSRSGRHRFIATQLQQVPQRRVKPKWVRHRDRLSSAESWEGWKSSSDDEEEDHDIGGSVFIDSLATETQSPLGRSTAYLGSMENAEDGCFYGLNMNKNDGDAAGTGDVFGDSATTHLGGDGSGSQPSQPSQPVVAAKSPQAPGTVAAKLLISELRPPEIPEPQWQLLLHINSLLSSQNGSVAKDTDAFVSDAAALYQDYIRCEARARGNVAEPLKQAAARLTTSLYSGKRPGVVGTSSSAELEETLTPVPSTVGAGAVDEFSARVAGTSLPMTAEKH